MNGLDLLKGRRLGPRPLLYRVGKYLPTGKLPRKLFNNFKNLPPEKIVQ